MFRVGNRLIPIEDYLFVLLLSFTFYSTRNAVTRLLMVVFVAVILMVTIKKREYTNIPNFVWLYVLFIVYGAIQVAIGNSINTKVSEKMIVSLVLNIFMFYFIVQYVYLVHNKKRVLQLLELSIFLVSLFVCVVSYKTLLSGRLGVGTELNSNVLGLLCFCGFIINWYFRREEDTYFKQRQNLFKMSYYVFVIILTGSRKSLLMILISVMIIATLKNKKKFVRNMIFGILLAFLLFVCVMKIPFLYNSIGYRIDNLLNYAAYKDFGGDYSLKTRSNMIEIGMSYFQQEPWKGYGFDCYKCLPHRYTGEYSHNNYIELLIGGGIPALFLYYVPFFSMIISLIKRLRENSFTIYFFAFVIAKLSMEYGYVSYYSRVDMYLIAVLFGYYAATCKGRFGHAVDKKID